MASCPASGCTHMGELVTVMLYGYTDLFGQEPREKIMPQPHWCQEAAMVGFFIDQMRERIKELESDAS